MNMKYNTPVMSKINPDDIKAGYTLGFADAQILRDAIKELNQLKEATKSAEIEATDAFLNTVRADAIEDAAKQLYGQGYNFEILTRYAKQLRTSNDKVKE